MRPEDETKDERLPVAVPASIKAWVRDRARVMGTDSSNYVFDLIVQDLYTQQGIRTPSCGIPKAVEKLKAAQTAIQEAFRHLGMIRAGGMKQRERRTA
jgi:hypothetical protein